MMSLEIITFHNESNQQPHTAYDLHLTNELQLVTITVPLIQRE